MNEPNTSHRKAPCFHKGLTDFSRVVLMSVCVLSAGIPGYANADDDDAAAERVRYGQVGRASWYGPGFHGKKTASGQPFNQHALTAAHRRLPLGSRARVTNLGNGRTVEVTINDRGPYGHGRIIDLSRAAARRLAMGGTARVRIETLY